MDCLHYAVLIVHFQNESYFIPLMFEDLPWLPLYWMNQDVQAKLSSVVTLLKATYICP